MNVVEVVADKAAIGKAFKKEAKVVMEYIGKLNDDEKTQLEKSLNEKGYVDIVACNKNFSLRFAKTQVIKFMKNIKSRKTQEV